MWIEIDRDNRINVDLLEPKPFGTPEDETGLFDKLTTAKEFAQKLTDNAVCRFVFAYYLLSRSYDTDDSFLLQKLKSKTHTKSKKPFARIFYIYKNAILMSICTICCDIKDS
jgi:hypothetical protein